MANNKAGSKSDPWVLSDSDSEPELNLDIHKIKPKSNPNSSSSKPNTPSGSRATLISRTNNPTSSPSSSSSLKKNNNMNNKRKDSSDDDIVFRGMNNNRQPVASGSGSGSAASNPAPIDTTGFVRLSTFRSSIVGTSYSNGSAAAGEAITFVREPTNPYDSNAIEVRARDVKIGHIAKDEARKFAATMDSGKIVLEGYILDKLSGGNGKPKFAMDIKGRESNKKELLEGPLRFTTVNWSGASPANDAQPDAKSIMESSPAVKAANILARVKSEPGLPPAAPAPAAAPVAPVVNNEPFSIVIATYHCYLPNAQLYRVELPAGSPVTTERNPFHGPVIRVLTQRRELAGTFPADAASKLIPLLDQGKVQLQPFVKTGVRAQDSNRIHGIVADIKCRPSEYEALKPQLQYFIDLMPSFGTGDFSASRIAASFARSAGRVANSQAPGFDPNAALLGAGDMIGGRGGIFEDEMVARARLPPHLDPDADLQEEEEPPQDQGAAPGAEMQELLGQMVAGTYRGTDALTSLYGEEGSVELAELPLHPNPDHWLERGITADLRSHQSQGVAWMQRAEHRQAPAAVGEKQNCLWHARKKKGGGVFWRNIASTPDVFELKSRHAPTLMKGGILADSMGLGKTLVVLALALSDPRARDVKEEDRQKAEDKKNGIIDSKGKPIEGAKSKAGGSAAASKDVKPKSQDLKPTSQELKKASLSDRTPSSSSNSSNANGSVVKKCGLILPSPPRRIPETDEEDSQTEEEEEDVKPKINNKSKKKSSSAMDIDDDDSEEDVKPDISKKTTKKKSSKVASDSEEEDVKPLVKSTRQSTRQSKAKMVDSDSDSDDEPIVKGKGKGKGKARKLSDSEEDVKPQPKKAAASKAKKPVSKKKKVAPPPSSEEDEMDEDEEQDDWTESNLIVCPLSVLHNWESQINEHTDRSMVNYTVFHGKNAAKLRYADLSKYKFVLTTYDQIKGEHKFTQEKDAIRTENLRHNEVLEDLEADLEEAKDRVLDASSRGEKELAQTALDEAKTALSREDNLHEANMLLATKTKKKGRASKKKAPSSDIDDDDSDVFSASEDEDYEKIKEKKMKQDQKKEDEIKESSIFTTKWRRVVLDEAHTIRNSKTAVFRAASDIKADRRWCATGTPIVNKTLVSSAVVDIGSLCYFLGMEPFTSDDPKLWNKLIELPIKKKRNTGYLLLKNVVSTAVLRRTKNMTTEDGTRIIDLPPLEKYHHTIPLDPETRQFYDDVEASVHTRVMAWNDADELHRNAGIMLVFLMRLRQICNDKSLVPANFLNDVRNRDFAEPILDAGSKLTADQIATLQEKLRAILDAGDDCPVCMEALQGKEPRITICSHAFCKACIEEVIKTNAKCPMDRNAIGMGSLVSLPAEIVKDEGDEATPEPEQAPEDRSAKANMLVTIIKTIHQAAPQRKSLVFSSYTSYLDKLAVRLRKEGIPICRFDGRMNRARRDAVLDSFNRPLPAPAAQPQAQAPAPAAGGSSSSGSSLLDALRVQDERGTFNTQPASSATQRQTKPIPKGHVRAEKERIQRDLDGAGVEIPRVMLISMGAGSVGLNLTAASNVFLMDPHWNTALEDQAIDRAHRIGQKETVKVFHIIAETTVEQRVLDIQTSKQNLVLEAFKGVKNRGSAIEQERIRNETAGAFTAGRTGVDDMIRMFGLDPAQLRRRHGRH